jgi:hypothetical protein
MKCGDIRYGYLHACEPYLSILSDSHRATIFLYRDPRDMLVSHVFYATELHKEHGMHDYYTQKLKSMEQRLNAAIQGVNEPGIELSNVKQRYDAYLGWLNQPGVLPLKFEDLILDRDAALKRLLDYLRSRGFSPRIPMGEAIDLIKKRIVPNQSGTFRKGVPGDWREHFTDSNKTLFNQIAGNLLVELGYEQGQKW